jgi:hypothetical protein
MYEHAIKEVGIVETTKDIGTASGNSTERILGIGAVNKRADIHTLRYKRFIEPRRNNCTVTNNHRSGELTE